MYCRSLTWNKTGLLTSRTWSARNIVKEAILFTWTVRLQYHLNADFRLDDPLPPHMKIPNYLKIMIFFSNISYMLIHYLNLIDVTFWRFCNEHPTKQMLNSLVTNVRVTIKINCQLSIYFVYLHKSTIYGKKCLYNNRKRIHLYISAH